MHSRASLVVAKADNEHLAKAALNGADKISMQLHAIDGYDQVRLIRGTIKPHGTAVRAVAEMHGVHRRHDRNAQTLRGHTVSGKHLTLPLLRTAAVTAHSGDDKGLCPKLLQALHRRFHNAGQILDAAAPHADCHTHTRLDQRTDLRLYQLAAHGALYVGQAGLIELLTHTVHLRQRTL